MTTAPHELMTMVNTLNAQHGGLAVALASVLAMSRCLFRKYGSQRGANLEPLLALQDQCVETWARINGVATKSVRDAVTGLERAGLTTAYLDAMDNDSYLTDADPTAYRSLSSSYRPEPRAKGHSPRVQPSYKRLLADPEAALRDVFLTLHGAYQHERRVEPGAEFGHLVLGNPQAPAKNGATG